MNNKYENWMNDIFAPRVVRLVFGVNYIAFMMIIGDLAFGGY